MKKIQMFLVLLVTLFIACSPETPPQPKTNYEIFSNPVTGVTKYHFFLEKKGTGAYVLTQGMDYLAPNITSLKVGEAATPVFTVNIINDGAEYKVGIVGENAAGFYSGLGVAIGTVGVVPTTPAGVGFRKKP